jgi:hypothetical protein
MVHLITTSQYVVKKQCFKDLIFRTEGEMGNQVFWDKSGQTDGNIRSIIQVYCNITSSVSGEIIL